jgi:ABC-type antimicrobial peptide transport system permease subunit
MTEAIKTMTVTEDVFLAILGTMNETDEDFKMLEETLYKMATNVDDTYERTLKELGAAESKSPVSINFYAKDFDSKAKIEEFIADYNAPALAEDATEEQKAKKIEYTDLVGALMSSVTIIIDVISYVLIAFVSISLVVSSIMIGIITNISVLERTKEIGILRAIGASKKDVSRVFNAETFIIGLIAGVLGIAITLLLCIPTNAIIFALTGFANVRAVLPPVAGLILVIISMGLTMIAGIIPAKSASKKDPVVALRTE